MQAKNFRIGNLLTSKQWHGVGEIDGIEKVKNGFEIKVRGYVHKWKEGKYFDLTPIKLNYPWLENFGFKRVGSNYELDNGKFHMVVLTNKITNELVFRANNYTMKLEYVHELQNVFFAISKTELQTENEYSTCS